MMLKALFVMVVAGLMAYAWYRNDLRRIIRDYARLEAFHGTLQQRVVRFPLDDTETDCLPGADRDGLYMTSSPRAAEKKPSMVAAG